MVNRLSVVLLLSIALMIGGISNSYGVSVQAKLDTTNVYMGDTVEFTFTVHDRVFGKAPDFSALNNDFEILSNRQSSQTSIVNGEFTAYTRWVLTLLPKKQGFIAVPGIEYDGQRTSPLKLRVTERQTNNNSDGNDSLFLDAVVDKKSVYVQEQLIYTIRVFKGEVDLYDTSFTSPRVDDAVMEQLGDRRQYQSTLNGRIYEVIEFKYAIFPQKSGEITIPSAELIANVFQARNRGYGSSPFNGKQVRRVSPVINIEVKAKPDEYPKDKPWLPARSLQLKESWSPANTTIKLGEPVTRTITIETEGLTPSQLPPLPSSELDNAKIYPEQADTSSTVGPYGIVSKRIESQAIIPTQQGSLTLPNVEVTWWDVEEEKLKVTSLTEHQLTISGNANTVRTDTGVPTPATLTPSQDSNPESLQGANNGNPTWFWIAVSLAGIWLLTTLFFGLYIVKLRRSQNSRLQETTTATSHQESYKDLLNQFEKACKENDAHNSRRLVMKVFQAHWNDPSIITTDALLNKADSEALATELTHLDNLLYKAGGDTKDWNGSALASAVKISLKHPLAGSKDAKLEPLHPTME